MKTIAQSEFARVLYSNLKEAYIRPGAIPDGDVRRALFTTINALISDVSGKPTGADVASETVNHHANNALPDVTAFFQRQAAGSLSLVFIGEDHENAQDQDRARAFITAINGDRLVPTLIVLERGLKYLDLLRTGIPSVNESLYTTTGEAAGIVEFGKKLTGAQRTMVTAAYIALLTGGGNQATTDKVIIFYGENHKDVFAQFEYFAKNTQASHLQKRARTNYFIKSFVP